MLRLFIILTAVLAISGAHAEVDEMVFEENRVILWYEGILPTSMDVQLGEHNQELQKLLKKTTKLPDELSIPLNTL